MPRCRFGLTLGLVLLAALPAQAGPDKRRLIFADDFDRLSLRLPGSPDGRWDTRFSFGGRTLPTNGELQLYVDKSYLGLGLDPFTVAKGVLTITARPVDGRLKARLGGHGFTSGLLTTEHSFAFTYGYVEMRARLPAGKGLWPAFWLLPADRSWPPEIDVFEVLGDRPDRLHMAIHTTRGLTEGTDAEVGDLSRDFHVYGVDWEPERVRWYLDGRQVFEAPTPADLHRPMYLLIDLAVGGTWPGAPDESTRFPAEMKVDYVRAWATPATRGTAYWK